MKPSQWEAIGSVECSIVVSLKLVGYSKFNMSIVLYVYFVASNLHRHFDKSETETTKFCTWNLLLVTV